MNDRAAVCREYDSLISADENRAMFDRIAPYYDATNRILSLGLDRLWRVQAVRRLAPGVGRRYLDVGCGTGDMAMEILRQSRGSTVTGIDRSEAMLALGRRKAAARGYDRSIDLLTGDALSLAFDDEMFDGSITAFCIRNVTKRQAALEEIYRVLRPGGMLVILELTQPVGIMRPLFALYSDVVIPAVTRVLSSKPAYKYLTDSMADFPPSELFTRVIADSGFVDVEASRLTGGIVTLFAGRKPCG
jgi:demethylmenaquinone methyltransferase / 2-methoxy-6-polyprenyl-1,4-benzoquinol methylase